jgi:endonuclease/exonuclease/phosphatase family metal-dependent hydrolase
MTERAPSPDDRQPLRLCSFNIRFGTADDGENHWSLRKDAVVVAIRQFAPDVLGTQETLAMQRDYLLTALPHYRAVAAGRDDGKAAGEMTALFYRVDRLDLLDSGHFWLSTTPERPGSKDWDAAITRMASWVKLRDRDNPNAAPLLVINTHFDHVGQTARLESARLIRRKLRSLGEGCTLVVMGDFNCGENSPPYSALLDAAPDDRRLIDTYRAAYPQRREDEATFQAFDATRVKGERIDWILVSDDLETVSASIDRERYEGRLPSDHFPVTAVVRR